MLASLITDFLPIAGQYKMLIQAGSGIDPVSKRSLGAGQRALSLAGALLPFGFVVKAAEARGGVYLLRDAETGAVMRTAQTGNLVRRAAEHSRDPVLKEFEFETVYHTDEYAVRRGLEQYLHDKYSPPYNYIRPISPTNGNRQIYLDAGQTFLDNRPTAPHRGLIPRRRHQRRKPPLSN